jgi:hypothetical protein
MDPFVKEVVRLLWETLGVNTMRVLILSSASTIVASLNAGVNVKSKSALTNNLSATTLRN